MENEWEFITIARIIKPRGLTGEVVAEILTDHPERFAHVSRARIKATNGRSFELQLEDHWFHKSQVVLGFAGCRTRSEAEKLQGCLVQVRADQLVPLGPDEYFLFQLIDCWVKTAKGQRIGQVMDVIETGAAPLLVVVGPDNSECLIPFAHAICPTVDIVGKEIVVDLPEGLLELNKTGAT